MKTKSVKVLNNLERSDQPADMKHEKSEVYLQLAQREPFLENFTKIHYVLAENGYGNLRNNKD